MTQFDTNSLRSVCWHAISGDAALETLKVDSGGLSADEVARRKEIFGANVILRAPTEGPLVLFWRQINSPLIWVLLGSAVLAIALGKMVDGSTVLAVVILNSIIGFIQEFKAGRAIEGLIEMVPENATVVRDETKITLAVSELVPGDIILLASGDKVPADVRLIAAKNLHVEEAALTGESVPVLKGTELVEEKALIGDRLSMAFSGTLVTYGTAQGVVVATGSNSELGKISKMLNETVNLETPLTKSLKIVAKYITIAILVTTLAIVLVGTLRITAYGLSWQDSLVDMLIFAIALAVAAIPEGLPAIMTIALGIGVQRMAHRKAIVRQLPAVETLGSTTVICTDKTGTLTKNEMTVRSIWTPHGVFEISGTGYDPVGNFSLDETVLSELPNYLIDLFKTAVLCNDATLLKDQGAWTITGDPTEAALVVAARKAGIVAEKLRTEYRRIDAIPFESENQFMATLHEDKRSGGRILVKGAPEVILKHSKIFENGQIIDERRVLAGVERMASTGMRVLAIASKQGQRSGKVLELSDIENELVFLGLIGMIDPPRPEAIAAVQKCRDAGITVKMITGDHRLTAQEIGKQLGLIDDHHVITGAQLVETPKEELIKVAEATNVFARVAPEHKLGLVEALQNAGEVVAMTGDGVNDAPALKRSNIGVAMGITGTSVSKASADIVLADDNFASIAAAVEEGRRVYDNLIKSLAFVLPTNIGLALILVFAVMFFPFDPVTKDLLLPMEPAQLLWINLIMTVALALPLAFEAKEPDIMNRPPRKPNTPIFTAFMVQRTIIASILMAAGALLLFYLEYYAGLKGDFPKEQVVSRAQTIALTTVIMFQVFYMLNCRSLKDSILKIGIFSNWTVYAGIVAVLIAQATVMYLPMMRKIFSTTPITLVDWGWATLMGMIILPVISVEKKIRMWLDKKGNVNDARIS